MDLFQRRNAKCTKCIYWNSENIQVDFFNRLNIVHLIYNFSHDLCLYFSSKRKLKFLLLSIYGYSKWISNVSTHYADMFFAKASDASD